MRYFFHLVHERTTLFDHEGIEMDGTELENIELAKIIYEIRSEESELLDTEGWSVAVVDENGRRVASVPL